MNILRELYFGNIGEISRKTQYRDEKKEKKEEQLYNLITENLGENSNLLEDFLNLYDERCSEYQIESYINGFKTGLLIGIDCSDFDI